MFLVPSHSPVLLPPSHALFIDRAVQLALTGENDLIVDDDGLDDLINVRLARHRILAVRDGHQGRTEADRQIVGIHHVFVTILGETGGARKGRGDYIRLRYNVNNNNGICRIILEQMKMHIRG